MELKPLVFYYFTIEDIIEIHELLIMDHEEICKGLLSIEMLQTCLVSPNCKIYGIEPFDDLFKKGAKLAFEIVCLHPFIDGNKRTAYTAASTLFEMNGYSLMAEKDEVVSVMLDVAKGGSDYQALLSFIKAHTRPKTR